MLCVLILYINGGTYSLKLTANNRFLFEKLFMAILVTLRVFGTKFRFEVDLGFALWPYI